MDDNNGELANIQIERERERVFGKRGNHTGGGSVSNTDPRFSRLLAWFFGALGIGSITVIGLAANNLYQLNLTVARGIDADAAQDKVLEDHEDRLRQVEREAATWSGRNLRGAPKEEPPRGQ